MKFANHLRLVRAVVLVLMFLSGCSRQTPAPSGTRTFRIGLTYIGPHELINQIVVGFREGMAKELPAGSFEIAERHANGDKTQVSATVNGVIASKLDVLATITTVVSQQALKDAPKNLPVVFVGVTDPVGAGLVKTLERPELSTGVSDVAPLAKILALIRQATPNVKKLALPYSPEEQPAVYSRDQVRKLGPELGFTIDARPVTSKDELPSLVRDLVRSNDAILVGADNGMFEAAPLIAKIATGARKPFYSADSSSVKAGAIAAVTIDYQQVGRAGATIVARVLKGEHAGDIPVAMMTDGVLEINETSLRTLRMQLSPELLKMVRTRYQ